MQRLTLDLETTGLDPWKDEILYAGFRLNDSFTQIVKWKDAEDDELKEYFISLMKNPMIEKVMHNANFDLLFCNTHGIPTVGPYFDTLIYYHYQYPNDSCKLKDLSEHLLGEKVLRYSDVVGTGRKKIEFKDVPFERVRTYLEQDVSYTTMLYNKATTSGVPQYLREIEFPLIQVILDMELRGMKIDLSHMSIIKKDFEREKRELELYFKEIEINPRSPKQIGEYMKKMEIHV